MTNTRMSYQLAGIYCLGFFPSKICFKDNYFCSYLKMCSLKRGPVAILLNTDSI